MMKVKKLQKMKRLDEKGFMSIEAIMSMAVVLMVVVLGIGFFSYMIPRQAIEEEVHLLGRVVKMEGSLKQADIRGFQDNMVARGMAEEPSEIDVKLYYESTAGKCTTPMSTSDVVSRGDEFVCGGGTSYKVLRVVATVPAKKNGVAGALSFFGVDGGLLADEYVFQERIMSEHYGSGA